MIKYYIETDNYTTPKLGSQVFTNTNGYVGKLLDITREVYAKKTSGRFSPNQSRYFIETGFNGVPLPNTLTTTRPADNYIDITDAYLSQTVFDNTLIDETVLYCFIILGNSIATNMSSQLPPDSFINVSINSNKKIKWDVTGTTLSVVDNTVAQTNNSEDRIGEFKHPGAVGAGRYNPAPLIGNQISRLIKANTNKNIQFITISGSVNGSVINQQSTTFPQLNNSDYLTYLTQAVTLAKTYADGLGKTLRVPFIYLINGEQESLSYNTMPMTPTTYKAYLNNYYTTLQNMVSKVIGTRQNFKIYRHQQSLNGGTDFENMRMKTIELNVADENLPIVLPLYPISVLSNFEHPDTIATFRMVGIITNNIFKGVYLSNQQMFVVKKVTKLTTNKLKLKINVPVPPLKVDTSRGVTPNNGFYITAADSSPITISNINYGIDEIEIETATDVSGGQLYYQYLRPYLATSQALERPGSYIVDSDNANYEGLYTPNYLLSFQQAIA